MVAFFDGVVLGFSAAVPIGPINLLIMAASLASFRSGVLVGFGALSADLIYLALILLGIFALPDPIHSAVSIFGAIFMLYMAFVIFANRNKPLEQIRSISGGATKAYMSGLMLTLLNPYTIAFWVSASGLATHYTNGTLDLIAGVVVATVTWVVALPYFVHQTRGILSQGAIRLLAIFSSIIMAQIGVRLATRLFL